MIFHIIDYKLNYKKAPVKSDPIAELLEMSIVIQCLFVGIVFDSFGRGHRLDQ